MVTGHIRFAADVLRRLGEELNPGIDQGIIELVKNAYDANARSCEVELISTESPGGAIRIVDNGDGMTGEQILGGWLVVGRSAKRLGKATRLGRRPVGSKGLGRLAALRMGDSAHLTTRPRSEPLVENTLSINWPTFDTAETVEEVSLAIETARRHPGKTPGTEVLLSGLRSAISRQDVRRLARSLVLLADPFADDPTGFNPRLEAPEYSDLERLVKTRYFDDADLHLVARVDARGLSSASVLDYRGKTIYKAGHGEIKRSGRSAAPYHCPPCTFDLWLFVLSHASFQLRPTTVGEVRAWLHAFGGVHVYQNGIRVAPYGNPGSDWLEMNLRRVRSPEERPSTNNSIGRVAIDGGEEVLLQKTDRSGFIESEAFGEIRDFAQDSIDWLARRRMERATRRRAQDRAAASQAAGDARSKVESAMETVPPGAREKLSEAFAAYDRSRERESHELRKELQLYRTLSTAGITAATFAHESQGSPLKVIAHSLKIISRRGRQELGPRYAELFQKPVADCGRAAEGLAVLGSATLSLVDHQKRRVARVDVYASIAAVLRTFEPFLVGRDVNISTEFADGRPYLLASQAAIESIVTNLLNNSLVAFERSSAPKREIRVRTSVADGWVTVDVLDNGPGIEGIDVKDIWLPGETTRPNGTGLGLAIVRDTVLDLGGRVHAQAHSALGGAQISVGLPVLGW